MEIDRTYRILSMDEVGMRGLLQTILPEPIRVEDMDTLDRLIELAYEVDLQFH